MELNEITKMDDFSTLRGLRSSYKIKSQAAQTAQTTAQIPQTTTQETQGQLNPTPPIFSLRDIVRSQVPPRASAHTLKQISDIIFIECRTIGANMPDSFNLILSLKEKFEGRLTAVFTGDCLKYVLEEESYHNKFREENPFADLIEDIILYSIDIRVCLTSAELLHFKLEEFIPEAEFIKSAEDYLYMQSKRFPIVYDRSTTIKEIPNDPLHLIEAAILNDDVENFIKYYHQGHRPSQDSITSAIIKGNIEILNFMIMLGIFPNQNGINAAAIYGRLEVVKYLIALGLYPDTLSVIETVENDRADVVKLLTIYGAWPNARLSQSLGKTKALKYLVSLGRVSEAGKIIRDS